MCCFSLRICFGLSFFSGFFFLGFLWRLRSYSVLLFSDIWKRRSGRSVRDEMTHFFSRCWRRRLHFEMFQTSIMSDHSCFGFFVYCKSCDLFLATNSVSHDGINHIKNAAAICLIHIIRISVLGALETWSSMRRALFFPRQSRDKQHNGVYLKT